MFFIFHYPLYYLAYTPVIRMYLLNETESGPDAIVWDQKKGHNALD